MNNNELREKIRVGLDLTFKKLIEQKRKTGGVLVFSDNGKIIKINATDFKI